MNYTHAEAKDARRKLISMLPENITVYTGVLNFGKTLSVMVTNQLAELKTYEFGWVGRTPLNEGKPGPEFDRQALFTIADEWSKGTVFKHVYASPATPVATIPYVSTKDALIDWVGRARKGDTCVYYTGSVAAFRDQAPRRIVELQKLADQAPVKKPRPAVERAELQRLQKTQELLTQINLFMRKDLITLSQRPDLEGNGTAYLAIRKGNQVSQSHPYLQNKLEKAMTGAINLAFAKYTRDFKIAGVTYEGGSDEKHECVALVLLYRDNPNDPITVRIPARDLGDNQKRWPQILSNKAEKAKKLVNAREGRVRAVPNTFEDSRTDKW